MKKILVIGSEGFTGRNFKTFIQKRNLHLDYKFLTADINEIPIEPSRIFHYECLSVDSDLKSIITGHKPDFIVNLGGLIDKEGFRSLVDANLHLPYNIISSVIEAGYIPEKVLLIGSSAEYGFQDHNPISEEDPLSPVNIYGLSKLFQHCLMEYFGRASEVPIVMARTFNISGKGISEKLALGSFAKQINSAEDGGEILVGNLESRRDVLDIDEVVKRYWNILMNGSAGEVYNVCAGYSISMKEVLEKLIIQSGKRIRIRIDTSRFQSNDLSDIYGDNSKYDEQIEQQ